MLIIFDSEVIFCSVDADALTSVGYPTQATEIARRFAGIPHRDAWEILCKETGFQQPPGWLDQIRVECERRFESELRAIPDAARTLRRMSELGHEICVASSTGLAGLQVNLARTGLLPLVEGQVFSVSQVKRAKPAPDVFLYAASQLGFDPADCLVIEDTVAGVSAARRAGMKVFGFVGGGHAYEGLDQRLLQAGAQHVCRSMDEVIELVSGLSLRPPSARKL
jgi:HAD superfamily hydrolase (TIGR01509 family)